MSQSQLLQFESTAFPVIPGEDGETNPGLFGKSLAYWIAERFQAKGLPVQSVLAEDFGWCVVVPFRPYRGYVVCCSVGESHDQWSVFAFVEGGLLPRLFGRDRRATHLSSLYSTLKGCLQESNQVHRLREEPHAA
jgi:hypothetical protein